MHNATVKYYLLSQALYDNGHAYVYFAYVNDLRCILIHKDLLPYFNYLCGCHHHSNKGVWRQTRVSHIELLKLSTYVINILQEKKNDA